MSDLFTLTNLGNLGVLIFLQAVLGFDNLLYVSLESQRAPPDKRAMVRRNGILIAIALRIVLLFVMVKLIAVLEAPFFSIHIEGIIEGSFNFATIVFLLGGVFIMYTAVKEIGHMLSIDDLNTNTDGSGSKTAGQVTFMIVLMNLVFSFDSILSALAITDVFAVLAVAIISSGVAMLVMADRVSDFLQKNRKYEVLGLFILLIVGIVLLGEGGHVAHLKFGGYNVEPLSKTTFYFSIVVLVIVDVIQSKYKKKLDIERSATAPRAAASP